MSDEQLKPCPWCGEKPKVSYHIRKIGTKLWDADCVNDSCVINPCLKNFQLSRDAAVAQWNTRFNETDVK
jgi:hypothetical protein